jgi:cystathionine gamma-synthase
MSSNYTFKDLGEKRQYDYTRSGNPTRDELGVAIADLEGGAGAVITSTGMSTITLALHLTKSGDHVVAPHDCYGGSYRLLKAYHDQGRITCHFVDQNDQQALDAALSHNPTLVLIETPSNPLLRVVDVAKIAKRAKAVGALVAVDNTFLSPAQQLPITLGADLVLHSTTKYLNGHSDVVGGAVVANSDELLERVAWWANCLGITASPFDSYQTLRGLRTLFVRIKQAASTTLALAKVLESHPAISQVYFPGLESSPGHALAKRQQTGFGAMISFEVKGGYEDLRSFILGLKHFSLAESLGGVESLIAHPATMTHAAMDAEARKTAGISDNLVRISVGIEDETDLINDILASLAGAYAQNDNAVVAAE